MCVRGVRSFGDVPLVPMAQLAPTGAHSRGLSSWCMVIYYMTMYVFSDCYAERLEASGPLPPLRFTVYAEMVDMLLSVLSGILEFGNLGNFWIY